MPRIKRTDTIKYRKNDYFDFCFIFFIIFFTYLSLYFGLVFDAKNDLSLIY